ncbi:efflux RND transporter periplasmic adaptor subunit [Sporosarcina pasteurii]|uniref:Uncharacterized protein n=1 Tax=Sporosarcina pasteurii TaxID=1474 RepID=A0A380BCH9_SPOPA|nr:efflux RND transporter periplasmic adaptor subunit [Sporosarcina pasteurii]MDS9472248.1 efflux RND transporter periplasmic adaptor subunit [Sporosarcina pasteurii]QBQ06230.1 efflux RND transporter periplasmic adaptor subunit [Sporosarcina pasteurii]SUI99141.1 Uncharacterised protein [Sporosarcina pasteurii]
MIKFRNIAIALAVSAFLATNFYLLYSEKSVIPKLLYVKEYERMTTKDYEEKLFKETLVAPLETHTVYVNDEDAVELWLVMEGDSVAVGQELALLNTDRADGERDLWETERAVLLQQERELQGMIDELASMRANATSNNASNVDRNENVTEVEGRTTIELGLNIGFVVDVTQEGAYSQAIAAIEQQLTDVSRQLAVVEAQLAQDDSRPALISPVTGTVSKVTRHGTSLAVDIYSQEQVLVTYVKDEEWQKVEEGQQAQIQGGSLGKVLDGNVLAVSKVPAKENNLFEAYKELDSIEARNPLAYYEVRVLPDEPLENIPFAANLNATVTVNDATDAVAIQKDWTRPSEEGEVLVTRLEDNGKPVVITATTPFDLNGRTIITEGLNYGDIVMHEPTLRQFEYAPKIFLTFPTYKPKKEEWKAYGWRNYLEAMLIK